jgi:tetratricopeptide (TPR) repeat protein
VDSKSLWGLIPSEHRAVVQGALILVLVFLAYLPSFKPEFIWDDDTAVYRNPLVRADNGLYYIWCSALNHDYWPLTYTSFWFEWRLWGENAVGYRVSNVLLHACAGILLWRVLRRLQIRGCWWAALIYGLHPVCVASAAWITERKNTLSLVFFLVSVLWYLRYAESPESTGQRSDVRGQRAEGGSQTSEVRGQRSAGPNVFYALSLFAFLLALLSKTSVVVLPLVLLICIAWRHNVVRRSDWLKLAPFFVLSIVFGAVTVWFQQHGAIGSSGGPPDPLPVRLLAGSRALWFYLGKALVPLKLSVLYDKWAVSARSGPAYLPVLGWLALLGGAWFFRRRIGRGWFLALLYFTICLLPVAGFFDVYYFRYSWVADHWQYLALMGIVVAVVSGCFSVREEMVAEFPLTPALSVRAGLATGRGRTPADPAATRARANPATPVVLKLIPAALALCFGWLTWQRSALFGNSELLWQDSLKQSPHSWVACNNLANALDDKGRGDEAVKLYLRALQENPNYAEAHNNLGTILARLGDQGTALSQYQDALRIQPGFAEAHNNLASLLLGEGKIEEARTHFLEALRLQPDYADAHYNLGTLFEKEGKAAEAYEQYVIAARFNPAFAQAYYNAGNLCAQQGNLQQAATLYARAVQIAPTFAEAQYNLGLALSRLGRVHEGNSHMLEAVRLKPSLAPPQSQPGNTNAVK